MSFSPKTIRTQLGLLRPLLESCSLETIRKGQNMVGELMGARHRSQVIVKEHPFQHFESAWIIPRDERRQGVILYLHGGGYTCGDLDYAKGCGEDFSGFILSRFPLPRYSGGTGSTAGPHTLRRHPPLCISGHCPPGPYRRRDLHAVTDFILGMMLIVIAVCPPLRESLHKKFFI